MGGREKGRGEERRGERWKRRGEVGSSQMILRRLFLHKHLPHRQKEAELNLKKQDMGPPGVCTAPTSFGPQNGLVVSGGEDIPKSGIIRCIYIS